MSMNKNLLNLNLGTGDKIVVPKSAFNIIQHHAVYLGKNYFGQEILAENQIGNGVQLIDDIVEIFDIHCLETEIISASVRHPVHVVQVAKAGSHYATIPYGVIEQMIGHPLTTSEERRREERTPSHP